MDVTSRSALAFSLREKDTTVQVVDVVDIAPVTSDIEARTLVDMDGDTGPFCKFARRIIQKPRKLSEKLILEAVWFPFRSGD